MNGSWKQQTQKGKPTKPEIIRKTLSITVGLIIKYHACIIKNLAQVRCCSPPSLLLSHHRLARTSGPLVLIEGAEWYLSMVHQLNTSIAHFALITSSYIQTAFGQLQRHSGELSASSLMHWTGSFLFDSRGNLRRCIVSHQHHHHLVVHYQTAWFASCVSTLLFISGRLLNCSSRCPTGSTGSPSGAWRWLWLCWIKWAGFGASSGLLTSRVSQTKGKFTCEMRSFPPTNRRSWFDHRTFRQWSSGAVTRCPLESVSQTSKGVEMMQTPAFMVRVCVCVCGGLIIPFPSPLFLFFSWSPFHDVTPVPQPVSTRTTFPSLSKVKDLHPFSHFVVYNSALTCNVLFSPHIPPLGCYF